MVLVFDHGSESGETFEHAELFDRIARRHSAPFSRVLLKDSRGSAYYRGVPGLGGSIEAVAQALRSLVEGLEPSEVLTFGEGLGGHAALVFGVLLGARRIVAIEPAAHLIAGELARYHDRRWERVLSQLPDPAQATEYAVPALMERVGFSGRAFVLFGTKRGRIHADATPLEVVHAHWLAVSDRVRLCPFPDHSRGLLPELSRQGNGAAEALSRYLFPAVAAPGTAEETDEWDPLLLDLKRSLSYNFNLSWFQETNLDDPDGDDVTFAAVANPTAELSRRMTDEWRRWLTENLLLGAAQDGLVRVLSARGYSEEETYREIRRIFQSPYFQGARSLRAKLKKREWLLTTYRKLRRLHPRSAEIDRRLGLSGPEFLRDYAVTNRPVIITGMIDDWPALKTWSLDELSRRFGDRSLEAWVGPKVDEIRRGEPLERTGLLRPAESISAWRRGGASEAACLMIDDNPHNHDGLAGLWEDLRPITEYLDRNSAAGDSLWLGPPAAIVPMHYHLTNSLIALVIGSLWVRLTPSWDLPISHKLPSPSRQNEPPCPARPDRPLYEPQVLETRWNPGEILFLPVGWGLSVEMLRDAAAVWFADPGLGGESAGSPSRGVLLESRPW